MSYKNKFEIETPSFGGMNTALQFSLIPREQSPSLQNAYQDEDGDISKRPGSKPVHVTPLDDPIEHLTLFPFEQTVSVGSAPVLTAVGDATSTLDAGTYYVRYTHVTDNGETEASAEASITLPAALTDPDTAPTLGESADGTETLPDQEYFVAYSWENAVGETLVSPESSFTVTAGNKLDITIPALPTGATSANIYVGAATGTLYLQANIAITTHSINAPIDEVTLPPEANTAIATKLRVTVPALPLHANQTNVYIATATNTEKLEGNTTTTTFDQSTPLDGTGVSYPTTNTTAFRGDLLASSGTSLFSLYNGEFHEVTMTDALESADIYDADFTGIDSSGDLVNVKVIADGGDLKIYTDGTVSDITPASDDASPAAANVLTEINAKGIKYVWEHSRYIFVSPGTNEVFYSKRAGEAGNGNQYDYFPETQFELLVRKGDYVNGCGVSFDDRMMVPMRFGWSVWTGVNFDDFDSSGFLNTINGVIAPRSIDRLTYPGGLQTIAYLSDDGCHEIFTSVIDTQGRQYATRSLMKDQIDWHDYGFTDDEMAAAVSRYIVQYNLYLLEITRDTTTYVFGFDTRNKNWYVWTGLTINTFLETDGVVYFAGDDGFLKKFDKDLYSDWDDADQTTGTPVHFKRYSPAVAAEFSGFASMWDAYLVESKQHLVPATLDITFIFANNTDEMEDIIRNEAFIEGVSQWGYAKYVNLSFTDLVNEPNEIIFDYSRLSKYVQVLIENDRDEPVKLYHEKWKGRSSGR